MSSVNFYKGPLARRIVIYVVLISACVTLVTSSVQIYSEFKRDVHGVYQRLDQLEKTQLSTIAARVWVLDIQELSHTLNSLLELPSIEYVEVYDYDKLLLTVGNDFTKNAIVKEHRLVHEDNNQFNDIGSIKIKASLDDAYSLILQRAVVIIVSNGFKTFIVAGFILFIFYRLVAIHLIKISNYTRDKKFLEHGNLELVRNHASNEIDELDLVVDSINDMREELRCQFNEISSQKHYLSLTLNSIADAVITTDTSGKINSMNAAAEKLTGWSYEHAREAFVSDVFKIIDSQTLEPITNLTGMVIHSRNGALVENNSVLFSRDGSEYHISYKATPIKNSDDKLLGIVLIFHDISEQYLLRENIAKNKRDTQAIMDNSPAVIYIKDIQGNYLFLNRRFEILFNVNREATIGKSDYKLFAKDVAHAIKRNDDNVKRAGHALELEESLPHPDGELHTYISVKFPLLDEAGNIYAICGISTDITDRKIQENHLRRAQKMDALGKLTSGIAHDYNNMLGIILGYAQLLEASLQDKPTLQKYAKEIRHAGDRGTKLTKKLLDFSSQDSSDAITIDVNQIVTEEQNMLEKTLTARIRLNVNLADDLWVIHVDGGELEDALVNMCINAMHAIEDKGEITIKTFNKVLGLKEAERLQIKTGEYVVLSLSDTGCGMDETIKDKIFDPFFSTKGAKGTGLGLSQVYGFMERSSGTIEVTSSMGNGTRFDLYFPRSYHDAIASGAMKSGKVDTKVNGYETVLVVDDEPSLVNLVNESLVLHGYNVLTASNGQEALDILNKQSVDLVISDIIMPKLDGTQLAVEVKKNYPHVKIQMVSGYADNRLNNAIDGALARQILYKPFSMDELIDRVRKLLEDRGESHKLLGCTILVMDDLEDVRELFRINLNKLGCDVVTARNGEEAVSVYKKHLRNGKKIDIVILDLSIPGGLGGKEVALEFRSIDPNVKLILSSGYMESIAEGKYERYKINGVLEKNFNRAKLKQVLENVLN